MIFNKNTHLTFDEKINLIEQNKYLDKFINDRDKYIRLNIAKKGYKLNVLINDPDWEVRSEVAEQSYGLDKLINDPDYSVRNAIMDYCEKHPEKQECKNILLLNKI